MRGEHVPLCAWSEQLCADHSKTNSKTDEQTNTTTSTDQYHRGEWHHQCWEILCLSFQLFMPAADTASAGPLDGGGVGLIPSLPSLVAP